MPTPRSGVAGSKLAGLFAVVGGEEPRRTFREVETFNPSKNQWIILPSLPTARHGLGAATIGNKMYVIGGGKRSALSISGSNEVLEVIQ